MHRDRLQVIENLFSTAIIVDRLLDAKEDDSSKHLREAAVQIQSCLSRLSKGEDQTRKTVVLSADAGAEEKAAKEKELEEEHFLTMYNVTGMLTCMYIRACMCIHTCVCSMYGHAQVYTHAGAYMTGMKQKAPRPSSRSQTSARVGFKGVEDNVVIIGGVEMPALAQATKLEPFVGKDVAADFSRVRMRVHAT